MWCSVINWSISILTYLFSGASLQSHWGLLWAEVKWNWMTLSSQWVSCLNKIHIVVRLTTSLVVLRKRKRNIRTLLFPLSDKQFLALSWTHIHQWLKTDRCRTKISGLCLLSLIRKFPKFIILNNHERFWKE